jgi:hypothetical protein
MIRSATLGLLLLLAAPAGVLHAQYRPTWLIGEVRAQNDDQPRGALHGRLEYGRYLSANVTAALILAGHQVRGHRAQPAAGASDTGTTAAEPGIAATLGIPAARVGLAASGRTLLGAPGGGTPALWHAQAGLGLGAGISLRIRGARDRYLWTAASVDTLVLVRSYELAVDRAAAPGWAGELAARREDFGDANPVSTIYGWLLAPLSRSERQSMRVGYALGWQNAEYSNWVPAGQLPPAQPFAGRQLPGRYAPYYTPKQVLTHSAVAAVSRAVGASWLSMDGAVGVHATEQVPTLREDGAAAPALQVDFHQRRFTPFRAAIGWTRPLDDATSLTLGASYSRTAYYGLGSARLTITRSL